MYICKHMQRNILNFNLARHTRLRSLVVRYTKVNNLVVWHTRLRSLVHSYCMLRKCIVVRSG